MDRFAIERISRRDRAEKDKGKESSKAIAQRKTLLQNNDILVVQLSWRLFEAPAARFG